MHINRIIYIIGAGRSGTTLLDIILGNAPEIFSAGELNRFAFLKGKPPLIRDELVNEFWVQIRNRLAQENITDYDFYAKISRQFEYHHSILTPFFLKRGDPSFKLYSDFQKKLFKNIAILTRERYNKTIISDSSKYPMRGLLLSKIFGNDISFIYIKRNPTAVVESFQKKDIEQPPKNRLQANVYLLAINIIASAIIREIKKKNKVVEISYDDLIQNPLPTLNKIENTLSINLQPAKNSIANDEPLKVGLLFDGNRLRLENQIVFNKKISGNKKKKLIDSFFYPLHKLTWYN